MYKSRLDHSPVKYLVMTCLWRHVFCPETGAGGDCKVSRSLAINCLGASGSDLTQTLVRYNYLKITDILANILMKARLQSFYAQTDEQSTVSEMEG